MYRIKYKHKESLSELQTGENNQDKLDDFELNELPYEQAVSSLSIYARKIEPYIHKMI